MQRPFKGFGKIGAAKLRKYINLICSEEPDFLVATLVDERFGAKVLDYFKIDWKHVEFDGEKLWRGVSLDTKYEPVASIQRLVTSAKHHPYVAESPVLKPGITPLEQFIQTHGFKKAIKFERILVRCPSVAFNERENRSLKEKIRCKKTINIDLIKAYLLQDNCISRMRAYKSIVQEVVAGYEKAGSNAVEDSASKKARLELAESFKRFREK